MKESSCYVFTADSEICGCEQCEKFYLNETKTTVYDETNLIEFESMCENNSLRYIKLRNCT